MRLHKKTRRALTVILIITVILGLIVWGADSKLRPIVSAMGEARVRALGVTALNEAVKETILGNPSYVDLVEIVTDANGKVTSMKANTIAMNDLASKTALNAQSKLSSITAQGLDIPIGSLLGGQFFVGKGPAIHIKIIPAGSVTTQFRSEFEYAGINQTRHRIFIELTVNMQVVIPPAAHSVQISSEIPVSETIIVGDVPETYIDVNDKNDMLELVPIK